MTTQNQTQPTAGDARQNGPLALTMGRRYDLSFLRPLFARFALTNGDTEAENFIDIIEGYHPDNYFDRDGLYLGADEAGVEPLYWITEVSI